NFDALTTMADEVNNRLNEHLRKLRPVMAASTFESTCEAYAQAFPDVIDNREGMRDVFVRLCQSNLRQFQLTLMAHADLRIGEIFTFSVDDVVRAYGDPEDRLGVTEVLRRWSHQFADLAEANPKHFIYS